MPSEVLDHLADHAYRALKAAFSELMRENPGRHFYAFAVFTDDSLRFIHPAANTEEALTATVQNYRETVDPKYGTTSTRAGMRWSYGDWGNFANFGEEHFEEIDQALIENIDRAVEEFEAGIEWLWAAALSGLERLEKDGFFGAGPERFKNTLLLVGDLDEDLVNRWVSALNHPEVADRFINRNSEAPLEGATIDDQRIRWTGAVTIISPGVRFLQAAGGGVYVRTRSTHREACPGFGFQPRLRGFPRSGIRPVL